ncbi:MBL fold metallo-hydrolase [Kribbella sp. NBC_01484]|uniref:MBL fold metallo-hydrolase n=1 Tax=Kribbella sp. NBC_01484 TaxID=2903579 RepID=UPI003FA56146
MGTHAGLADAFRPASRWNRRFWSTAGATSLTALRQAGFDPNEIRTIVVSHLHGDHFGGLLPLSNPPGDDRPPRVAERGRGDSGMVAEWRRSAPTTCRPATSARAPSCEFRWTYGARHRAAIHDSRPGCPDRGMGLSGRWGGRWRRRRRRRPGRPQWEMLSRPTASHR